MSDRPYTSVLFDLDGTIVDSAPGITASLARTLEDMGEPVPTPAELLAWVGPPIMDSFRDLGGFDLAESHRALEIYRGHYLLEGVFAAQAIVPQALTLAADRGIRTLLLDYDAMRGLDSGHAKLF